MKWRRFQYFTFREYLSYVFAAYKREVPDVSGLIRGFHFEGYVDVLLKDLSTGNRRKAFLITAFALKPELLFLDEPVNGLDFESTEYLYRQIAGYREYGTVLFSSHILESITLTSDRVFVLEDGRIRQTFESGQINAVEIREALRTAVFFALQASIFSVLLEWFFPVRGWKIESDLWHHPRKYIVPAAMLMLAGVVGIMPGIVPVLVVLLAAEILLLPLTVTLTKRKGR